VAVGYALAVALFMEGAARLAFSSEAFLQRVLANDDSSWRLRWAGRQRRQPHVSYAFDEWSPTRGWALKPGVRGVPMAGGTLNSNSRGIRGRREYAYDKPAGVTRIVVLGDSFTFGEDVGDQETYSHRLEESLPGTEVLNLGVHGYGHDQMLIYLREQGLKYQPDVVILGFLYDDMERNVLTFRDYGKPRFVLEGGRLLLRGSPVPPPDEMLARERWRWKLADLLKMLWLRNRWSARRSDREMKDLTLAILDEMKAAIESAGARPAFAYLPVHGEITRTDPGMTGRERFFFSYCRERGIQSMYLRPFFRERMRQGVELKAYGHWGPTEHKTAAEGMKAYLVEKGLVR
jgi:hypothetical protein